MLLRTQNDTFKPFLTAEVNKALKTLAESPKMLVDIYKARIAGQQIGIQIHNHHQAITNTQNNNITTNLVTIEKVIELAHENSKTLLDKGNSLAAKYDVHSMPIISAMDQTGVDNGRAGKAISLIKSQQIDIDNHLSRREKDLGLDS
jgi:hypothetical protein